MKEDRGAGDAWRVISLAQELLPDGEGFRAVTHIPTAVVERIVDRSSLERAARHLRTGTLPAFVGFFDDREEGCTMAASVRAVSPHPSGIGR